MDPGPEVRTTQHQGVTMGNWAEKKSIMIYSSSSSSSLSDKSAPSTLARSNNASRSTSSLVKFARKISASINCGHGVLAISSGAIYGMETNQIP